MSEDLLFEVGTEELPAGAVEPAADQLRTLVVSGLDGARLGHGAARIFATPRRLAVLVEAVEQRSPDVTRQALGPSVKAAFAPDGSLTKAAIKFAEAQGVAVQSLRRVQAPKGEYLAAEVTEPGRPASALLPGVLGAAVHGIEFRKSMRWGEVEQTFARPVQWLLALHGLEVVPVVFADVKSGRMTLGHRFLAPGPHPVADPREYPGLLERAHVLADVTRRKERIRTEVAEAARKAGGRIRDDEALLDQVTELVEWPTAVLGSFEERHLDLPPEVLVQEMTSHQRYFPVVDAGGKLLPRFVAISNTPVKDPALSRRGYERVLRSRLTDGRFFFDEDRKVPLAARVPALERVVWQGKLGTYAEKVGRIRLLAAALTRAVGRPELLGVVDRAALLAKADLTTGMVGEFPELQGIMGREYALSSGEPPAVAQAVADHYLPRGASDPVPADDPGALVGIADRLDTLAGLFALGKPPTASADPFGLRRACLGVVHLVLGRGYRLSLGEAVDHAFDGVGKKLGLGASRLAEARGQLLEFFRGRLRALWADRARGDVVEAVLAAGFDDLRQARARLDAFAQVVGAPDFTPLAIAFKRVANILEKQGRDVSPEPADPRLFREPSEIALSQAARQASTEVHRALDAENAPAALAAARALKGPVDAFFDQVLVMTDDRPVRENRVRLLREVAQVFAPLADLSRIQAEGGGAP
ncbi:MAG TPA: glycine--tRNA ligase subunit beta [Myxococcaceae bacterium]|nr:glycine--tRNA ligase subunit beta [Myxococcaceae bacterium]